MGLDIHVGWLAMHTGKVEAGVLEDLRQPFLAVSEILSKAGLAPHVEPLHLREDQWFEAQLLGYGGLHTVRRLAAYHVVRGRLPTAAERQIDAFTDPVLEELYRRMDLYFAAPRRSRRWAAGLLGRRSAKKPPFQHLIWHSDCEGFYVPQAFDDVLMDDAEPQRQSVGGMVGSAVSLLSECRALAALIGLPDIVADDDLVSAVGGGDVDGPTWRRFGEEAYCLTQLIRGCERSLDTGAALFFT